MENLRSSEFSAPRSGTGECKEGYMNPGGGNFVPVHFHFYFDLCLSAEVKKRREAPLRKEQHQWH